MFKVLQCSTLAAARCNAVSQRQYGSLMSAKEAVQAAKLDKSVKFIDASWYMDKSRSGHKEFLLKRIQNAQFFDIDSVADRSTDLPHMLPNENEFARAVEDMGISSSDHVVVYTHKDSFAGPRVWWTFRAFGHKKVSFLQGGLQAWEEEGQGPVVSGDLSTLPEKGHFQAKLDKKMVSDAKQVLDVIFSGSKQILDARSVARFQGTAPEPRPNLAGGHIPGSLNLPFTEIFENARFKTPLEIKEAMHNAGIVLGSDVICTCGSGVTAAVLLFGLHMLGQNMSQLSVYDGSWSEWGIPAKDLPIHNPSAEKNA